MRFISIASRMCVFGCIILLSACGSGSDSNTADTTSSTSSLIFSATSPTAATPATQTFTVTFGAGTLYLVVNHDGTALQTVDYTITGNTATITAHPVAPSTIGSGIFSSTIIITAYSCGNADCTQMVPGNTSSVVATYTIPAVVQFVAPYVGTAGSAQSIILRGEGFQTFPVQDVQIGGVSTSFTVVNDTQINTTYPASLAAGTYPVDVIAPSSVGPATSQANLVLQTAPGYTATTLAYPSASSTIQRLIYDAERHTLLVARTTTSATQEIDSYPYSAGWSAATSTPISGLADIALSTNGTQLLALSQTDLQLLDPVSFTAVASVATPALSTSVFYNDLAMTNNNYAIVTSGYPGNASTPMYLYSVADSTFTQPLGTATSPISTPSPNNTTTGVSADGSLVVLPQGYPGNTSASAIFTFSPATMSYAIPSATINQNTITPALDRAATRIILNGTNVYDANFTLLGTLPSTTLAVVVSPDASHAYTFDSAASQLLSFDLTATPAGGAFPQLSATSLAGDPGADVKMTISPDGGSLFLAGTTQIVIQPTPP